jgi:hypothetical protein
LNLRLVQGPSVNPHFVDNTGESESGASPSNIRVNRGVDLRGRNRAGQDSIVEDAVDIDIQGLSSGIVNGSHVIPGAKRADCCAIALRPRMASVANSDRECLGSGIGARLELPAGIDIGFGHDVAVIGRIGCCFYPCAPSHASGDLHERRIGQIDITEPIEAQRGSIGAVAGPSWSDQGAGNVVAGVIVRDGSGSFIETVCGDEVWPWRDGSRGWRRCGGWG